MASLSAVPASTYTTPIYHPIQPHRSLVITSTLSTRKSHFRRLYDIYHVALQRGNLHQAKKAYSLLVRCKEFDWAANWRSGMDMVDLPRTTSSLEDYSLDGDTTMDAHVEADRQRRLLLLKVDYLRECHTVHSRKARSKRSLREPEAILLQIIMLLASAEKYTDALNELELYLPLYPYRDNALLHYYAGLLCIYLAQLDLIQDQERLSSLPSSQFFAQTGSHNLGFASSQAHISSSVPHTQGTVGRSRSSSSSSSSTSSSSSDDAVTASKLKSSFSSKSSQSLSKPSKSSHRIHTNIKEAISFSETPSPSLVQKILQASPMYANDARKWFDLARKISHDKSERFDELEDWLGLMNGRSVEETRSQRKIQTSEQEDLSISSPLPREYYYGPPSTSSPSAVLLPIKSQRSILKTKARQQSSSSYSTQRQDDEEGDMTITQMRPILPSSRLSRESDNDALQDEDDDDDDEDPFGRTKEDRRKRERNDRMVTFASVGEGFDLDMSE